MLFMEIIAVCSQNRTKYIKRTMWKNAEFLSVKCGGTYSNHWTLKSYCNYGKYEYKYHCRDCYYMYSAFFYEVLFFCSGGGMYDLYLRSFDS